MTNEVRLCGTVKRSAKGTDTGRGNWVLDFAVEVPDGEGRTAIIDCCATNRSQAYGELEGYVTEGETVDLVGHLIKRTETKQERMAGALVEVRITKTIVYVDAIEMEA